MGSVASRLLTGGRRMFDPRGRLLQEEEEQQMLRTPPFMPSASRIPSAPIASSAPPPTPDAYIPEVTQDEQALEEYQRQLRSQLAEPPPTRPKIGIARKIGGIASSLIPLTQQFTSSILEGDYPQRQAQYLQNRTRAEGALKGLADTARTREGVGYTRGQDAEKNRQWGVEQDVALAKEGIVPADNQADSVERVSVSRMLSAPSDTSADASAAPAAPTATAPRARGEFALGGKSYRTIPKPSNMTPEQKLFAEADQFLKDSGATPMERLVATSRAGQAPSKTLDEEIEEQSKIEDAIQKVRAEYKIQEGGIQDEQLQTTASALLQQAGGDVKAAIALIGQPQSDPKIQSTIAKYAAPLMIYLRRAEASEGMREMLMRLFFGGGAAESPTSPSPAPESEAAPRRGLGSTIRRPALPSPERPPYYPPE